MSWPHGRSHIVAAEGVGVCDGPHWAFVMNKESSSWPLIPENVLDLRIQIISSLVDEFEIASFDLSPRPFAQVLSEHGLNESGSRLLRSRNAIDPSEYLF